MALPAIASRVARKVFRDARGRFVSKQKYDLIQRRSKITGRFLSKQGAALERQRSAWLTQKLGRAPAGQDWVKIADKYADRFGDLTREMNKEIGQ